MQRVSAPEQLIHPSRPDVACRDLAEERMRETERLANSAAGSRARLLRDLSYSLRTPLTPIVGYTELLLESDLTPDQRFMVEVIHRNAEDILSQMTQWLSGASADNESSAMEEAPPINLFADPSDSTSWTAPASADLNDTASPRVLIAEDSPGTQSLLQHLMKKFGMQTEVASDGYAAVREALLAATADRPFDLILMDIQMPGLDGWEATRQIRTAGLDTPIIAMTALAHPHDIERCFEAGCQEAMSKPVTLSQFADLIERWLPMSSTASPAFSRDFQNASFNLRKSSPQR